MLVDFAAKYCLQHVVDGPTHGAECLDLISTNNRDLVSFCKLSMFRIFADHKVVSAHTSFSFIENNTVIQDEQYLCPKTKRYKSLDYLKARWPLVNQQLSEVEWGTIKDR